MRKLPQGIGGFFADANFPPVPKIQHFSDERDDLVDVQYDIREFQTSSHVLLTFLSTLHSKL